MNVKSDNFRKINASSYLLASENSKLENFESMKFLSTRKGAAQRTCMVIAREHRGMQSSAMYMISFCIF